MAKRFVPVTRKVNVFVLVSLTVGIGSVTLFLAGALSRTIDQTTADALDRQSAVVYEAIEQLMMPGQAPLVEEYFRSIEEISPDFSVQLFRRDGVQAFTDNETIQRVNIFNDMQMFMLRAPAETAPLDVSGETLFQMATSAPPRNVMAQEQTEAGTIVEVFKPLLNLPKCTGCHQPDHTVRGVIRIQANISASVRQRRQAIYVSAGAFLLVLVAISAFMTTFLRFRFIAPLRDIESTCRAVTGGDFEIRSSVDNNDELGVLSETVNTMIVGLYERFELSRYVSGSTIKALGDTSTSRNETLTLLFSDVRGFTSFTESHPADTVVATLNHVLSLQTDIIIAEEGDIDKYVGDEIVAVFTGNDADVRACRAAMAIQEALRADESGQRVGIGINHGSAIVGEVGSSVRADFTVIGDNVNVTARLCSAAEPGEILLSDSVATSVREVFDDEFGAALDGPYRMEAKGKSTALRVYKLTKDHPDAT